MKRLFGLCVLLFAFVLASCGLNETSLEKGSLEFSIPVAEILALREETTGNPDSGDKKDIILIDNLIVLVQIKGSGKYYQAQIKKFEITQDKQESESKNFYEIQAMEERLRELETKLSQDYLTDDEYAEKQSLEEKIQELSGSQQNYFTSEDFADYSDANLNYEFDNLPLDQDYTIMVDIFYENIYGHADHQSVWKFLNFTGDTSDVTVLPGQTTPVNVDVSYLDEESYLPFDLLIIPAKGDPIRKALIAPEKTNDFVLGYTGEKYYYKSVRESEYNGDSEYEYTNQDPADWIEIADMQYAFKESAHFEGFNFSQSIDDGEDPDTKETIYKDVELDLSNGYVSIYDSLKGQYSEFKLNVTISKAFNNLDFSFETSFPKFNIHKLSFVEQKQNDDNGGENGNGEGGNGGQPETFTNDVHGSLLNQGVSEEGNTQTAQNLVFNKRMNLTEKNRFIHAESLDTILGNKTLNEGDTVVFVMKIPAGDTTQSLGFTQFYYQLQTDKWEDIDNEVLFEGNECINCDNYPAKDGYITFVMPLNFVHNPAEYNTVLFFFDSDDGTSTEKSLTVSSLDYHIFPASTKTFVFGLGQNWADSNPYRYEFKLTLADEDKKMINLVEDDDVSVTIQGTVKYYGIDESVNLTLSSELYDGAYYVIAQSYKPNNNDYYHPLSNTGGEAINTTTRAVSDGVIAGNGLFNFGTILAPCYDIADPDEASDVKHNYLFQCYTPCTQNPTTLLVIQNFKIVGAHTLD